MSQILQSAAVTRVREALMHTGISTEIVELPGAARTARQAAAFLGCDVAQIANSLVFRSTSDEALLVMSSGAKRVELDRLAALLGESVAIASTMSGAIAASRNSA